MTLPLPLFSLPSRLRQCLSLRTSRFDGGVRQAPPFVQRMNDFVHTKLPGKAWCHSCTMGNVAASMNDVSAVSWMGNEGTVMPYPLYNANDQAGTHTGQRSLGQSASFGVANGTRWMPAHCDAVLRRHFWFWSTTYNQSANLNTPQDLLGMHLTSVGRGCNMVLDMSPTPTGLLQANDVATYGKSRRWLFTWRAAPAQLCLEEERAPDLWLWKLNDHDTNT